MRPPAIVPIERRATTSDPYRHVLVSGSVFATGGPLPGPAEHDADAGVELLGGVRLDDGVGAGVERADGLPLLVASGSHDDGDGRDGAEHPQQLETVDVGQPDVEDDDVRPPADDIGRRSEAGRCAKDDVATARSGPGDGGHDAGVVLHDSDRGHGLTPPPGSDFRRPEELLEAT
jgi:hypothetical protein